MPLTLMAGINGSGKDTIIKEVVKNRNELVVLSGAQILMHNLGIDVGIEATFPPQTTREMYLQLENTPTEIKSAMRDTVFKDTLLNFKESGRTGVLFSQLVVAFTLANEGATISYEPEDTHWYSDVFDKFIYVKATSEELIGRREKDAVSGARDRGRVALNDINEHQALYDKAWEELSLSVNDDSRLLVIQNSNGSLDKSINYVDNFLFGKASSS